MILSKYSEQIWSCGRCGHCGEVLIDEVCPSRSVLRFESATARGKMLVARAILDGKIRYRKALARDLYTCSLCGACKARCEIIAGIDTVKIFEAMREEVVEQGLVPSEVRDFLENTCRYSNPWKKPREKRSEWIKGTGIRQYKPDDEFLYYAGCAGSYDTRAKEIAKALGKILLESGLSFGILDAHENCDGNDVRMLVKKVYSSHWQRRTSRCSKNWM